MNPVLPGFHPDPSICRVGDTFYVVASSFTWFPGVPVFRSTDLVAWEQIGNVLDRPSQLDLTATHSWASLGVYAPTIRYREGRFWMITTNMTGAGARNFFVTAEDPAGPWSEPVFVDVAGIDPDLCWDDDGNCWVHFSRFLDVARVRIDDATGEVLAEPEPTWSGTGLHAPEAPHLFQRDGIWYLLIAEGGTERGHGVSIARGPAPTGPWEGHPDNPIVSHRSTSSPIQNVGHADLVDHPDGSWSMVLLGVRPKGITPGFHVLGRETFLAPVEWIDGWPVVGAVDLDQVPAPLDHDDFSGGLHPRWIAIRRSPSDFCSLNGPGLDVSGGDATLDDPEPAFLGRRQQHHEIRVQASVDPGTAEEAGLAVVHDDTAHYEVAVRGGQIVARARTGPFQQGFGRVAAPEGPVALRIETVPHQWGPDTVRLGFDVDGEPVVLAEIDGRYLSTEVVGGFIGRVIGMYAVGGTARFDWFDYEGWP